MKEIARKDLAHALGLSCQMVSRLRKRGMPSSIEAAQAWRSEHLHPGKTKKGRVDGNAGVALGTRMSEDEALAYRAAKARRELALAQLAELDLAEREQRLISLDVLEIGLSSVARQVAAILDRIPASLRRRGSISAQDLDFIAGEINRARTLAASIDTESIFFDDGTEKGV